MKLRSVKQIIKAAAISEGAGVTVFRTIGTPALRNLDPFLMLDFFNSSNPDDYIAGFPDHPHRGFITFTYMLNGHMQHQDSMGNRGDILAGDAQWMKAASGVIHSEMPKQSAGLMQGFQLWINLPSSEKMSSPEYQEFSANVFPVVTENGVCVKILCGDYNGHDGPIKDPHTNLHYFDVSLEENKSFTCKLDTSLSGFIYVFEGNITLADQQLQQHTFAVFDDGDAIEFAAVSGSARLILVAGHPINEPIVQHGPFVMNTQQEIEQAIADYHAGKLVQEKASLKND